MTIELTAKEREWVLSHRRAIDDPRDGQCNASVMPAGGWRRVQCSNKAKPGTDWCGVHSDEAMIRREIKDREETARRIASRKWRQRVSDRDHARLAAFDVMHKALRDIAIGMNTPTGIAYSALSKINPDATIDLNKPLNGDADDHD